MNEDKLTCRLCHHACQLADGDTGFCRARGNRGGRLASLSYGLLTSVALDPIEKKPLYHFYPGSRILSVGSFGCNLACPFCQNYSISQAGETDLCYEDEGAGLRVYRLPPEELAALTLDTQERHGYIGVAFNSLITVTATRRPEYCGSREGIRKATLDGWPCLFSKRLHIHIWHHLAGRYLRSNIRRCDFHLNAHF